MENIMLASVSVACRCLSDDQIVTLNLVGALDSDPRRTMCWPDATPLFTTERNGIPVMHDETKRGVTAELYRRGLLK